ncbi:MAG: hypothetical protein A2046_16890 [Bacteroidetes bacterium GWA2_30_7]|nr:MAG: hypothetical protein A2046_16890 [Bacteroidetes bacterium GWA2_30_7]
MLVAFLRSINVGGRNIIKMKELSAELLKFGFSDVQTYIQSGNIVFNYSDNDTNKISSSIEKLISKKFNLKISVVVFEFDELIQIIENCPFKGDENKYIFVTLFKSKIVVNEVFNEILNEFGDCFVFKNNVFYIRCFNGYSNTKFNNSFFEKKYKITATTRNIETLIKVGEIGR